MNTGIITQQPTAQTNEHGRDSTANVRRIGSINQRGYLKSMKKQGFTMEKCILELIANSIDAGSQSTLIKFHVQQYRIQMIDNGRGMNEAQVTDMFDMQKENHSGEKSLGISGIGGKVATKLLSKDREVTIYTHQEGEEYLKITIPWDLIETQGVYKDMVTMMGMTEGEKNDFCNILPDTGTIIEFPYSDELNEVLEGNFYKADHEKSFAVLQLNDRASIIFGKFPNDIKYEHWEEPDKIKMLDKYDYLGGSNNEFYGGKTVARITHWFDREHNVSRYIWNKDDGTKWEVKKTEKRCAKEPTNVISGIEVGFEEIGEYTVVTGMRIDRAIFDPNNPLTKAEISGCGRAALHNEYDKNHLHAEAPKVRSWMNGIPLVRNSQQIGKFPCPDIAAGSTASDSKRHHEYEHVRVELRYSPCSDHTNHQDEIMGIQQNKNQWSDSFIPINLSRMVKYIRKQKHQEIWNSWNDVSEAFHAEALAAEALAATLDSCMSETAVDASSTIISDSDDLDSDAPVAFEPVTPEPVAFEPVTPEPVAFEPVTPEPVAFEPVTPEPVTPEPVTPEPAPIPQASDVTAFRRGSVTGLELRTQLTRVLDTIDGDGDYTHAHVTLFNSLTALP
jgi:hypothetical protein